MEHVIAQSTQNQPTPAILKGLSPNEAARVEDAIALAERHTRSEIKVIVTRHCWDSLLRKGETLFRKHMLHETRERNAVMILVVLANREVLLFGGKGIDDIVVGGFWVETRDAMIDRLRGSGLAEGLIEGIGRVGEQLAAHFPVDGSNPNELGDEVIHDA